MIPYFSIIVPTLNRCKTLVHTLKTIVDQEFESFELIISDNASIDESKEICLELAKKYKNIKYINPGKTLSMSKHWEYALNKACGEYVAFVGDDDGLVPNALSNSYSIIKRFDQPPALASLNCEYHWPSSPLPGHSNIGRYPLEEKVILCNSHEYLNKTLKHELNYRYLPLIYNGFVSKKVINRITEKTGSFFKSCIPDVYSGIAVASQVESYIFSEAPIFIYGVSGYSNGASASRSISTNKKFFLEDSIKFHKKTPFCISIPMLVAESVYQCIDAKILDEKFLPDPKTQVEKSILGSLHLGKERYEESINAIQEYALQFSFDASELIAKYPYPSQSTTSFPNQFAWNDKILDKSAIGIDLNKIGAQNITDFTALLPQNKDINKCILNILKQTVEDKTDLEKITKEYETVSRRLSLMESSLSWKISKPLRLVHNFALKLLGKTY